MIPSNRLVSLSTLLLAWAGFVAAGDTITSGKIKVQLFAAPSFLSEVSVDAYNNQCLSLDNNLNYDCKGDTDMDQYLSIADGANNLGSIGWGTKIHGLKCRNFESKHDD
ncbi:hypothetical protein DDE82_006192 [Stemphylium lycopersici]|uniref:Uncharacterized protein n=1 Tax=Stemphylium lycopersici TaxID=183478 RepID=A0A364NC28_STELY|nr:hypothetical protein TW65_00703 [Stemphylium lycopersici]RAR01854.1 hypothetical protein DDE82_006192 [Stemphylium lycopersici]RAR14747.1 hypothetical protein DDE83_001970 [Stemphylium lycopersici]